MDAALPFTEGVRRTGSVLAVLLACLCGPLLRPVQAGPPAELPPADRALVGNYVISPGHAVSIDRFVLDSGENALLFSDYGTGVVRRLFPASRTDWEMGPGFATRTPVELRIHLERDAQGNPADLTLRPVAGEAQTARRVYVREQALHFASADAKLSGTLYLPPGKGPHPAIILLHGSGPLTRHSFGPYPRFFASLGLAVLVYDKRGTGASTGLRVDASSGDLRTRPGQSYPDGLVNDALAALRALQARDDINPTQIGFWGSSEGGMLATQVAARDHSVAFAIDSSGFMDPLWQTLDYQVGATLRAKGYTADEIQRARDFSTLWMQVAHTGEDYDRFIAARRKAVADKEPWLLSYVSDTFASRDQMRWAWDHILAFSPLPALKQVRCPVLGVFGEQDALTNAAVASANLQRTLTEAGNPDVTVRVFANAGHSLEERPSGARMATGVFETLADWLLSRVQVP